jgi:hypothetical protein
MFKKHDDGREGNILDAWFFFALGARSQPLTPDKQKKMIVSSMRIIVT